MTKQWLKTHKHDSYYRKAKTEGYRSRAAYKLIQINSKFKVIHQSDVVLDLGAAPGGWSQVAAELVGKNGIVIGVDLDPIKKINDAIFLVGDITDPKMVDSINEHLNGKGIDIVISDAAPNISGNYSMDQARSVFLAEVALDLAKQLLKSNGNFVVKVFEGEDFQRFNSRLKNLFGRNKIFSPKASRTRSSEIYAIGLGLK